MNNQGLVVECQIGMEKVPGSGPGIFSLNQAIGYMRTAA